MTDITYLQPVEEGVNDREEWREYATWRVKEFFDMLKERYRKLELVCFAQLPFLPCFSGLLPFCFPRPLLALSLFTANADGAVVGRCRRIPKKCGIGWKGIWKKLV